MVAPEVLSLKHVYNYIIMIGQYTEFKGLKYSSSFIIWMLLVVDCKIIKYCHE